MTAPPQRTGSTRIPDYGLDAPTEADVVAALHRVWGPERGSRMWAEACRAAGVSMGHVDTLDRLIRVNGFLAAQGGATATLARSVEIRIRTWTRLQSRSATGPTR